MLMAAAVVTLEPVLRPATKTRAPTMTPTRELKLYSSAGATARYSLEPDCAAIAAGPSGAGSLPVRRVLELCTHTRSLASTQLRVALYSAAASAVKESPGWTRPRKPTA